MASDARPFLRPPTDRWRPARGSAGPTLAASVLAVVWAHTTVQVHRMRRAADAVAPLEHALDLAGDGPPVGVVVLGDSAAAGHGLVDPEDALPRRVGRQLAAAGRAVSVRSHAVDGATTADVLEHQVRHVDDADVVVIGVGANDALRRRRVSRVRRDTATLLREVSRRAPRARIVVLTCPDLSVAPALPDVLRPVVGWRCRAVARAQADVAARYGVGAVPVGRDRLVPEVFGEDGFHPGAVGHERLARRIAVEVQGGRSGRV